MQRCYNPYLILLWYIQHSVLVFGRDFCDFSRFNNVEQGLVARWNTLHLLAKGLRGRVSQCNEMPKDYDNACLNGMQHV